MPSPCGEGQFFMCPIEHGVYAVGLVARVSRRGGVGLGYFFGPTRRDVPSAAWLQSLQPRQAVLVCRFKSLSLYSGEWRLLDVIPKFDRTLWPLPAFHRFDGTTTYRPGISTVQDWRVEYSDDNLIVPLNEAPALLEDLRLGDDVVLDNQSLAATMNQILNQKIHTIDVVQWQ